MLIVEIRGHQDPIIKEILQGNQPKRHRTFSRKQNKKKKSRKVIWDEYDGSGLKVGSLSEYDLFNDLSALETLATESASGGDPVYINNYLEMPLLQLAEEARNVGIDQESAPNPIYSVQ